MARKARKFSEQNGRLALAALEFGYLFMCITHAPRPVILERMLPQTDALLAELVDAPPLEAAGVDLSKYLRRVILYGAFHAIHSPYLRAID